MDYRFSRLAKIVILLNGIFMVIVFLVSAYNFSRLIKSHNIIETYMITHDMDMEEAIEELRESGEVLYLDEHLESEAGMMFSVIALFLLYKYAKTNGFYYGFFAGIFGIFSVYIGGFLILYVLLSGRSQRKSSHYVELTDDWGAFAQKRNKKIKRTLES